jgi:hypothetical protein
MPTPRRTPPLTRDKIPESLIQLLEIQALNATRVLKVLPITPKPPWPTTVTLDEPLLATLLDPTELKVGASQLMLIFDI